MIFVSVYGNPSGIVERKTWTSLFDCDLNFTYLKPHNGMWSALCVYQSMGRKGGGGREGGEGGERKREIQKGRNRNKPSEGQKTFNS